VQIGIPTRWGKLIPEDLSQPLGDLFNTVSLRFSKGLAIGIKYLVVIPRMFKN